MSFVGNGTVVARNAIKGTAAIIAACDVLLF